MNNPWLYEVATRRNHLDNVVKSSSAKSLLSSASSSTIKVAATKPFTTVSSTVGKNAIDSGVAADLISIWHTIQESAEDKFQLMFYQFEAYWKRFATYYGINLSSHPTDFVLDVVLTVLVGILLTAIFVMHVHRKIRARALHKKRYGDAVFPPLASAAVGKGSIIATISLLRQSSPKFFTHCAELLGPVFRLNVPFVKGPMVVAVGDLQLAHTILNDARTTKPDMLYAPVASIVGGRSNILTSTGSKWNHSRQGVKAAFAKTNLQRMHQVCKNKTEEWIRSRLEVAIKTDEILDIGQELVVLTLSILCDALLEYRISRYESLYLMEEFNIAIKEFAVDQGRYPFRSSKIWGSFLPSVRRARLARSRLFEMGHKILTSLRKKETKRMALAKAADSRSGNGSNSANDNTPTVISCIAHNKEYDDDDHRVADIIMFLFSGMDSTAYSLAWTIFELAKPENKNELTSLRQALNGSNDELAHTILKDILREGMRLHPAVPAVGVRTVWKDFYLRDNSMVIPKGSHVVFPSILLTRNQVDNPEEFRPTRWRDHPNKSFLLFSSGPRNCVAQGLALAEMTWVLSRVCSEYDFDVIDEGETKFDVTNKCVGVLLKVKRSAAGQELRILQHPSLSPASNKSRKI